MRTELPWAYRKSSGCYFYFRTQAEAQASVDVLDRKGRRHGPVEHRPGECYDILGAVKPSLMSPREIGR